MRSRSCDVAVIGAGTAGLAARAAAAQAGAHTVLIDGGPPGTTCARVGCMPSKLLIAAARAAHAVAQAPVFGVEAGPAAIDGPAVLRRLRQKRDYFVASVLKSIAHVPEDQRIAGRARFVAPGRLAVGEEELVEAKAVVIATGARPTIPPNFSALGDRLLTSETLFELEDLPRSVAVIGAGPLGLELAQALARLGVRTTVFDPAAAIGGLSDPEVSAKAAALLSRDFALRLKVKATARPEDGAVRLSWSGDERGSALFDRVLVAAGRPPDLRSLDLDKAGVELDRHCTPLFDRQTMRCGDSAVFIAGDADHDRPVLHEASVEGTLAGRNAARYPQVEATARTTALSIIFTDPGIAVVGKPFAQMDPAAVDVGSASYDDQGRARVDERLGGLIRVYAEQGQDCPCGAEMVGPEAEHTAQLLAWGLECGRSAVELAALPVYHPTYEEGLRTALRELCHSRNTLPRPREGDMPLGPGG